MRRNTIHPDKQRFRISLPPTTHRMAATCEDVDCPHYLNGWKTVVAPGSAQDVYIRTQSRRKWRVEQTSETILTYYFERGQRCFREHTMINGREPFYLHETAEGRRVHRPQDFMEHVHEEFKKNVGLREV